MLGGQFETMKGCTQRGGGQRNKQMIQKSPESWNVLVSKLQKILFPCMLVMSDSSLTYNANTKCSPRANAFCKEGTEFCSEELATFDLIQAGC